MHARALRLATAAAITAAGVAALAALTEGDARACGGCFHEPPPPSEVPSVITDHRMILSISSQQTTLYDQIHYQGSPSSFAWVLPISGVATVGLSADVVFATLDKLTEVGIQAPPLVCPSPPSSGCPGNGTLGGASASDASSAPSPPAVDVVKQETVGPYETVQLKSDDPNALIDWLTTHNFVVPSDVKPIITAYTNEHFGFLAMKLVPGANVKSMRPVRVSTPGAAPVLPLRMVAAGTGATVGVTLWVVAEGRYEPANFPSFVIKPTELVWDYAAGSSDYKTIRAQRAQALGGRGWQVESVLPIFPTSFTTLVETSGRQFGPPIDAGADYDPAPYDGGAKSPGTVRDEDLLTLFQGMQPSDVKVSRIRSDLAHAALTTDLQLSAASDQSNMANLYNVTRSVNAPACPVYPPAPACPGGSGTGGGVDGGAGSSNGDVTRSGETFSCAAGASSGASSAGWLAGAGALVMMVAGARARRRRADRRAK
jgi:hypothetical protein